MRLNVYLLRDDVELDDDIFRATADPKNLDARATASLPHSRAILVKGKERLPSWADDVDSIFSVKPDLRDQQSFGVVILVERGQRLFAITFGSGFHVIESRYIEPGFGLRVAANVIAAGRIRGAQTRGIATNSRDQRTILPADGEFGDLDIQVDDDWMRRINGRAEDGGFASSLSGGDSLKITVPNFGLAALPAKLDEVIAAYQKDDYKVKFPFLDQMQPIGLGDLRLPQLKDQLRALMEENSVAYSAPDPFSKNEDDFHHYEVIIRRSRWEVGDLDANEILTILSDNFAGGDWLDDVTIAAVDVDGALVDRLRPLESFVIAEVELDEERYFVTAGNWFQISNDFVAFVESQVALIPDLTDALGLPDWDVQRLQARAVGSHREEVYNADLAAARDWVLLDKKLARYGSNNKIEVADVLTDSGHLLCIKAATGSPAISHLVAQATVSAGLWGSGPHLNMLRAGWHELHGADAPMLRRENATYVLAIATDRVGPLSESLYFFTKVLLANALRVLTASGLRVALARIEMIVPPSTKKIRTRKKRGGVSFTDAGPTA